MLYILIHDALSTTKEDLTVEILKIAKRKNKFYTHANIQIPPQTVISYYIKLISIVAVFH